MGGLTDIFLLALPTPAFPPPAAEQIYSVRLAIVPQHCPLSACRQQQRSARLIHSGCDNRHLCVRPSVATGQQCTTMHVKLTVLGGSQDGLDVTIAHLPLVLGREGDRQLPVIDRWASRQHCEMTIDDGRLFLRDLASKHGTFVNGERIDRRELHVGDRVMVGLTTFVIREIALVEESLASNQPPVDRPSGAAA